MACDWHVTACIGHTPCSLFKAQAVLLLLFDSCCCCCCCVYRLHSKPSKKVKVKELSYPSVIGKGGGLVRVYTALVSPLQYRVVVVCNRKSSVGEVVATALAKCGKEQDAKK